MDSGTYDFANLKKKYEAFIDPQVEISMNGTVIPSDFVILQVEIENTIENNAISTAHIKLQRASHKSESTHDFAMLQSFALLNKVEIKLGYGKNLKSVFIGYLFERTLTMGESSEPVLAVFCFCCKAFLRMNTDCKTHKEKAKLSDIAEEILKKYSFAKEVTASESLAGKMTIVQNGTTDFAYLVHMAGELGYEFFSQQDKLYFRKPMCVDGDMIRLTDADILFVEHKSAVSDTVSKVELYGYNQDLAQAETVTVNTVNKKVGSGKTAVDILASFCATHTASVYMHDKSSRKLDAAAKTYLQAKSLQLVKLTVMINGLPEIIPGRFMSLDHVGEDLNNRYYIQGVVHKLDRHGYTTQINGISNTVSK